MLSRLGFRLTVQAPVSRWAVAGSARAMSSTGGSDHDTAGSIRQSGGAFGKREKALEDRFIREQEAKALDALKSKHADEIKNHKEQIKRHEEAIKRHKEEMDKL